VKCAFFKAAALQVGSGSASPSLAALDGSQATMAWHVMQAVHPQLHSGPMPSNPVLDVLALTHPSALACRHLVPLHGPCYALSGLPRRQPQALGTLAGACGRRRRCQCWPVALLPVTVAGCLWTALAGQGLLVGAVGHERVG
jgi:hypothetical protein